MARIIGITHRTKKTAQGEARPTLIAIKQGDKTKSYQLKTERDELDFVIGTFPTSWRIVKEGEDTAGVLSRHIKTDDKKGITRVPASYDGLHGGDTVAMVLGGSGDRLAYALSRRADEIGAGVYRLPAYLLKEAREKSKGITEVPQADNVEEEGDDDGGGEGAPRVSTTDHFILALLAEATLYRFHLCGPRDRELIRLTETLRYRQEAQQERIACEHRLRQRFIGRIFLSDEGKYPEGNIEDLFDVQKADDKIYQSLFAEEKARDKELRKLVRTLTPWELFEGIEGCGEVISAGIISAVGDVRRFETDAKLKAFAGMHVCNVSGGKMGHGTVRTEGDGKFVRRRRNQLCNWNPTLRQALYLLGDQFNRRPNSVWGKKLIEYKAKFRAKYPEVVIVDGKKRYTNGHIHRMATWRTMTKFIEWLWREWTRLERRMDTPQPERKVA